MTVMERWMHDETVQRGLLRLQEMGHPVVEMGLFGAHGCYVRAGSVRVDEFGGDLVHALASLVIRLRGGEETVMQTRRRRASATQKTETQARELPVYD